MNQPERSELASVPSLVKIQDICRILNCTHMTVRRWVRDGDFPAPLCLSSRTFRWRREDIEAFLEKRRASSNLL